MLDGVSEIRVGEPVRVDQLSVFPLYGEEPEDGPSYVLADEAMAAGVLSVEEINEGGAVPILKAINSGKLPALFLEGEALHGAKQDRMVNTSLLVAAGSSSRIPVSCVEMGRWGYRTKGFEHGDTRYHSRLRHGLRASVSSSLRRGAGYLSDQGAVWDEVSRIQESLGTHSRTSALADTYRRYNARIGSLRSRLPYPDGARGAVVAIGPKVVGIDLFDRAETCHKAWNRMMSGFVMDALEARGPLDPPDTRTVSREIEEVLNAAWEPVADRSCGDEHRSSIGHRQASALYLDARLVHLSVVAGG